ncbi:MAG: glycoside hydrolase family 95 protein [Clostridiales bacterium]|jgi:alpha-L-fucosidase 2|nr:glycoside hydrolase family 95 protein [Clostridiales bacterium]
MKLWYKNPAETWIDCMPLGNGKLGMMPDGGVFREKIYLNDDTLWSGYPKDADRQNPSAGKSLDKVRTLILKGHRLIAETLLKTTSLGDNPEAYMPFGTVFIDYKTEGQIGDYVRELDIKTALHTSKFNLGGNAVEKRAFCSFPDKAGVMNIRSVRKLSFVISFNTPLSYETQTDTDTLYISGHAPDTINQLSLALGQAPAFEGKGMAFAGGIKVVTDGKINDEGGALSIADATDTLLVFYTATGFVSYDVMPVTDAKVVRQRVKDFFNRRFDFDYMFDRHKNDYSALFNRISLKLKKNRKDGEVQNPECGSYGYDTDNGSETPSDELLAAVKRGAEPSAALVELYYNYGRYLLISSSREGSEPATLQGIWNKEIKPPWASAYTVNINTEMNYWLSGSCNLYDCAEPFRRFMRELRVSGKKTAASNLKAPGFAAFHNSDIWRKTTPVKGDPVYAYFPVAGIWLTNELYSQYASSAHYSAPSGDAETQDLFEIVEDCARFANGWLIPHKNEYITCPSTSPEHKYRHNLIRYSVDYASVCDISLIWQLIENYKDLCRKLGITSKLLAELLEKQSKLPPIGVGSRGISEWYQDYGDGETGHRHFSPLYSLYPGNRIRYNNPDDKELIAACAEFMKNRVDNGGASTGWSAAWAIALYARLHDGEKAYASLKKLLEQFTFPSFLDKHPPNIFQIDGNLGAVAGINEMLAQSENGIIELLPALPDRFADGFISGLTVKGGYVIDMQWRGKKVVALDIRHLRTGAPKPKVKVKNVNLADDLFKDSNITLI